MVSGVLRCPVYWLLCLCIDCCVWCIEESCVLTMVSGVLRCPVYLLLCLCIDYGVWCIDCCACVLTVVSVY